MDRYFAPGKICIPHIPVGYAGGRAPKVGALGDAGAVADDCMDAGGRATQEQLPRHEAHQSREMRFTLFSTSYPLV